MNYTKGEWKLTDDGYVTAGEKYIHEPNNFGFQIKPGEIIPKEILANSRLIAAAPALYKALKAIERIYGGNDYRNDFMQTIADYPGEHPVSIADLIKQALTQAEGRNDHT